MVVVRTRLIVFQLGWIRNSRTAIDTINSQISKRVDEISSAIAIHMMMLMMLIIRRRLMSLLRSGRETNETRRTTSHTAISSSTIEQARLHSVYMRLLLGLQRLLLLRRQRHLLLMLLRRR